jgi:nitroreductase
LDWNRSGGQAAGEGAEKIREMVGAPETLKLICLLAIGHPAEEPEKEKRPLSEVLHWEKY